MKVKELIEELHIWNKEANIIECSQKEDEFSIILEMNGEIYQKFIKQGGLK